MKSNMGRLSLFVKTIRIVAVIGALGLSNSAFAQAITVEQVGDENVPHHVTADDEKLPPPAVAAPLPPAVLSGGLMLAGNFVLARLWKRKLV